MEKSGGREKNSLGGQKNSVLVSEEKEKKGKGWRQPSTNDVNLKG